MFLMIIPNSHLWHLKKYHCHFSSTVVVTSESQVENLETILNADNIGHHLGGPVDIRGLYYQFRNLAEAGPEAYIPQAGVSVNASDLVHIETIRNYSPEFREDILQVLYARSSDLILPHVPVEITQRITEALLHEGISPSLYNLVLAPGLVNNNLLAVLELFVQNPTQDQLLLIPNVLAFAVLPLFDGAGVGQLVDFNAFLESIRDLLRITRTAYELTETIANHATRVLSLDSAFDNASVEAAVPSLGSTPSVQSVSPLQENLELTSETNQLGAMSSGGALPHEGLISGESSNAIFHTRLAVFSTASAVLGLFVLSLRTSSSTHISNSNVLQLSTNLDLSGLVSKTLETVLSKIKNLFRF